MYAVLLRLHSGAWIAFPSYITYVFGAEILQGLESATGEPKKRA